MTPFAIAAVELARQSELERLIANVRMPTRWAEAAAAYGAGAFEEAAEIYADIGAVPDEAHARLRAAEARVATGRRAEADALLQRALALYRSVGATAYIREAEGMFAASA